MHCSCKAPLPLGFSRQGYCSGLPFPPPGDRPNPGIESMSLSLEADSLPLSHQGSPEDGLLTSFSQVSISDHCAQENLPALALSWGSACCPPGSSALTAEHAWNFPAEPPLLRLALARGIPARPPDVQMGPVARRPRGCLVRWFPDKTQLADSLGSFGRNVVSWALSQASDFSWKLEFPGMKYRDLRFKAPHWPEWAAWLENHWLFRKASLKSLIRAVQVGPERLS